MHRAGELRLDLTLAEKKLWMRLRAHRVKGVGFRRQHAVGRYIADFCAPGKMLIIELDGRQHFDRQDYDDERTAYLKSKGYHVLRFYNSDVINHIEQVLSVILENL